jgi:amidase
MKASEYAKLDGVAMAALVAKKDVTPAELLECAIARAEAVNAKLNAIVYKGYDDARKTAAGALPPGPFRGVPFLIKDLYCEVAGWPMSNGSRFFRDYVSKEDSELTKRFRAAGLVLMGKTNTPEFGITGSTEGAHLGPCRSPFGENRIAGGSSGGSASAVAAGIVPMAHASDGLGSIRIPAACNGLVGLKPTRGRNPIEPTSPVTGLSCNHIVSVSVRDTATMLDAIAGPEPYAPYAYPSAPDSFAKAALERPRKLRIAFSGETPSRTKLHGDVEAGLAATVRTLESLGHEVFERPLQVDWKMLYRAQGGHSVGHFGAGMLHSIAEIGRKPEDDELETLTKWIWSNARRVTADQSAYGTLLLNNLVRGIMAQWEHFDVFLCPTMITPPPEVGFIDPVNLEPKELNSRQAKVFGFTPPFNMTGQPSISLPLAWDRQGLPIGMMFTGAYADEATLLSLAAQLEEAMPWAGHRKSQEAA